MPPAKDPSNGRIVSLHPDDVDGRRYCPECASWLPRERFYKDSRASSGLTRRCKKHHITRAYESRKKHQPASSRWVAQRNSWLLRKYGISIVDYDNLFEDQGGRCAICGSEDSRNGNRGLVVDHDHATGQVRGLLCGTCNTALGKFRDDPTILLSAISYLDRAGQEKAG